MKRNFFFYGFAAFLFFCAAAYGKDEQEVRRSFTVSSGASIALENLSGNIKITSWDGSHVEMVAVKTGNPDHFDRVEISTSAGASRLNIRTIYPRNSNTNVSVRYDLKVPRDVVLDSIDSTSGRIEIAGINGSVTARTISGRIEIAGINGSVTARTISGRVNVSDVSGRSNIHTSSGRIVAENIKGDLVAEAISGGIRVSQVQDLVQAKSVSGAIEIDNSPLITDLTASTVSGRAIQFAGRLNPDGRYEIKCHSCAVTLNLPDDSNFVINASTSKGSIKSDFDVRENRNTRKKGSLEILEGVVGSGGSIVDLHTFSGNILIRKSTSVVTNYWFEDN